MVEEITNPSTLNLKTEPGEDLTDKELSAVEAGSSQVKEEHTDTGTFSKTTETSSVIPEVEISETFSNSESSQF